MEETRVLVTGCCGMLGSDICKALEIGEYEVFGLDLPRTTESPALGNGVRGGLKPVGLKLQGFISSDITQRNKVKATIKQIKPDLIIHTAAYTNVDGSELNSERAFAVNAGGTENIAQAAKELGTILFYISTDYVFDGRKAQPYTETDVPNPINIYGRSKLDGEKAIQSMLDKYVILRTSWLFGSKGENFVTRILQKTKENKSFVVVNDQVGSPTYTLDLAGAVKVLLSTLDSGVPRNFYGIYHITNSGSCSWYEFAREIISLMQLETQTLPVTSREINQPAQRPKMSILDNSKSKDTFGLRLRPWREALKHFLSNENHKS